jgi:hypothetical protein
MVSGVVATAVDGSTAITTGTEIALDYNGNGSKVNAAKFPDLKYNVTAPDGSDVTVTDGKFTPTTVGVYKVTATATVNKVQKVSTTDVAVYGANEVNAFYIAEDAESCGYKNDSTSNALYWLNDWKGRQGVVQMEGTTQDQYRNFYFDPSYRYWTVDSFKTYITNADNWDYISIKLWIDMKGDVTVNYIDGTQVVTGQTWEEVKIPRTLLEDGAGKVRTLDALATRLTKTNDYLFFIDTGTNETYTDPKTNVTVYVDSISLEKDVAAE